MYHIYFSLEVFEPKNTDLLIKMCPEIIKFLKFSNPEIILILKNF